MESNNFVAVPSLGQLVPGHMLLLPRRHVTSFGELGIEYRREALALYTNVRHMLSRRYSPVVSFEHGSCRDAVSGGCGILHAHVHIVPLGSGHGRLPEPIGHGWRESRYDYWIDDAAALVQSGSGYLMWHALDERPHLEMVDDVPSQYLRHHAAGVLKATQWDWRTTGAQREFVTLVEESRQSALFSTAAHGLRSD
jgi:diadenosine tetraphosphate (Ap4A) HIT family hydrolase